MSFSLPYRHDRAYLTGMDWILGALDYGTRRRMGLGGFSQAILDLDGDLTPEKLRPHLDAVSNRFPIIHGRVARDWMNLAPYWKVSQSAPAPPIPLAMIDLPENEPDAGERFLDDHINHPFESDSHHLRLLLIRLGGRRSRLGMVFDHRLVDAFGAEALLRLMELDRQGRLFEFAPRINQTSPALLDNWKHRIVMGRTLNQYMYRLNQRSVCALKMPPEGVRGRFRFVHEQLTAEQTADFNRRAVEEAGIPMTLPSAAARALAAIKKMIPNPPLPGQDWMLFTSAAGRLPGQEWEKLFFNQFSMVSFAIEAQSDHSISEIVLNLRNQIFEQMKQQIPQAMQDAGALARICPHIIGSRVMRLLCDGRFCSLYFACVRDSGYPDATFMELPITNLYHKPLVFAPPGMSICMTVFGGRFNLVISYIEGTLDPAVAAKIIREFKTLLVK